MGDSTVGKVSWCEVRVLITVHATDTSTQLCSRFPGYGTDFSRVEPLEMPTDTIGPRRHDSALCAMQCMLSFPMLCFQYSFLLLLRGKEHTGLVGTILTLQFSFHDNQVGRWGRKARAKPRQ